MTDQWWRVQAYWFVGAVMHQAEPTHYRSLVEAEEAAGDIQDTLWHIPTLEVVIAPATEQEARQQQRRFAVEEERVQRVVPHLRARDRPATVCGLPLEQVKAWSTLSGWQLGHRDGRCVECDADRERGAN